MNNRKRKNIVLVIAGHDPSGGAGIQADIETLNAFQCQAVTLVTSLTAQNTSRFVRTIPQSAANFIEQYNVLAEDIEFQACKIGLLPSAKLIEAVSGIIRDWQIPIIVDPVLRSGSGRHMLDDKLAFMLLEKIIPYATVVIPNSEEARALTDQTNLNDAASRLLLTGAEHVLITGTHETTTEVINTLYNNSDNEVISWPRLEHSYHGSGCTLASSIAALLCLGKDIQHANREAQTYTWNALHEGYTTGKGQMHPRRAHQQ